MFSPSRMVPSDQSRSSAAMREPAGTPAAPSTGARRSRIRPRRTAHAFLLEQEPLRQHAAHIGAAG